MKAQKDGRPPGSHDIDELFSRKLGNMEKQPSPSVWKKISGKLHPVPASQGGAIATINKWFFIGLSAVTITAAILFYSNRNSGTNKLTNNAIILPAKPDSIISSQDENISVRNNTPGLLSEKQVSLNQPTIQKNSPKEPPQSIIQEKPLIYKDPENQPVNQKQSSETTEMVTGLSMSNTNSKFIESETVSTGITTITDDGQSNTWARDSVINKLNIVGENKLSDSAAIVKVTTEGLQTDNNTPSTSDTAKAAFMSKFSYSLESYLEPAFTDQLLKERSTGEEALLDYRKRNENSSAVLNWGIEGRVSYKNLFIQTGLRYSVFGANADYPFTSTLVDSSQSHFEVTTRNLWQHHTIWVWNQNSGVVYYLPVQDSNLVQLYDSTWISLIDTNYNYTNEKSQLRYRYVEIPLLIGYQFGKGRLKTEISGGIAVGFLSGMKGNVIKNDLSSTIPTDTENIPYNKPLLNLLFRIGCSYNLNENWSIFTRPALRYTPQSELGGSYPLYQRHYSVGVQFGIKYDF